ncbi:MAG: TIGR04053 family radical SAM/SPASM domain-containing protein [Planctomycetota bacterium]|jgi:radical SAM protein
MSSDPFYARAPFIAIWECTRSCALACRHCRAEADESHHPGELTTAEGRQLISDLAAMGTDILVLSGGDPLQRSDLEQLLAHARSEGLRVGTIPAATDRLTRARMAALRDAGVQQLAMSLDAADAAAHDGFRGVAGCFERTMQAARWAAELKLPFQINTVFARWNHDHFARLAAVVEELDAVFWEVFFLVPTGRGAAMDRLDHDGYRELFTQIHRQQRAWGRRCIIKVTEAPHYRMFVSEAEHDANHVRDLLAREIGPRGTMGQAPIGINAGRGHCFISHVGDVQPSGFLPITCGNVRDQGISAIYRDHPLMRDLRDPSRLGGRCGHCRYNELCGGSRARAFALNGDPLAEDHDCWYGQT